MLKQHRRAVDQFGEEAVNSTNQETLDGVVEELEALQQQINDTDNTDRDGNPTK